MALTAATLPWIVKIADVGVQRAMREIREIRLAVNTLNGHLTNDAVGEAVHITADPIDKVLG